MSKPATQPTIVESVTQYGVQTPNSSTILVVTTDRAAAQQALGWITGGRIVHRTITYWSWHPDTDTDTASEDHDLAETG